MRGDTEQADRDARDGEDGRRGRDGRDGDDGDRGRRGDSGERGKRGKRGRPARRRISLFRFVLVTVLLFWLLSAYYNDGDVPLVPGISSCMPPGATPDGEVIPAAGLPDVPNPLPPLGEWYVQKGLEGIVSAGSYAAGRTLNNLSTEPPDLNAVQKTWNGLADAGAAITGAFIRGLKGAAPPDSEVPLDETPEEREDREEREDGAPKPGRPMFPRLPMLSIDDPGCAPCPGTSGANDTGAVLTARAALAAGWTGADAVTAVAVAGAESSWNPRAENPESTAKGLWQTMMSLHGHRYDGDSWSDPVANARVAHELWRERGWQPWTVYHSGAYKKHLAEARAAVQAVRAEQGRSGGGVVQASVASPAWEPIAERHNLQPAAARAAAYVMSATGFAGTMHGYGTRGNATWHDDGLAVDFMVKGADGDQIAALLQQRAAELGVRTVIWEQRIWTAARADEGWRPMADRGSVTANHYDHVHADFEADGGTCGGGGVIPLAVKS